MRGKYQKQHKCMGKKKKIVSIKINELNFMKHAISRYTHSHSVDLSEAIKK